MNEIHEDQRSTARLLEIACMGGDSDDAWEAITTLRSRATPEMLDLTEHLISSGDPEKRCLGANILAQLGWQEFTKKGTYAFQAKALELLRPLLHDDDNEVVTSAAIALGHRVDSASIPDLLALKDHDSADVRLAVVVAASTSTTDEVVDATLALSRDPDTSVRDWATFSLGSLLEADNEAIRGALADRLTDENRDVVFEAVVGLGSRKDARAAVGLQTLMGSKMMTELPGWISDHLDENAVTALLRAYNRLVDALPA